MPDIQREINDRIDAFVTDITDLAKKAAYETLSSALETGLTGMAGDGRRMPSKLTPASSTAPRRRKGGKRSPDEIAETADALFEYIRVNPGQRMEAIAKAMGSSTKDLTLPIKKLLSTNKVIVEGQKRATSYYPAPANGSSAASSKTSKAKRRGRRKKS